jgi:hypothetical protein
MAPREELDFNDVTQDGLLSLIEAEYHALEELAASVNATPHSSSHSFAVAPELLRSEVNRIFSGHAIAFRLTELGRIVDVESQELNDAVVAPALHLLNTNRRFASAEKAYQDSLTELRDGDAGDAITDAGTALQEVLKALGCTGNTLGDLLKSAKKTGLIRPTDAPLTDAVIQWVAAVRNHGEAHTADHGYSLADAWMVVHVVGALMIRLTDPDC